MKKIFFCLVALNTSPHSGSTWMTAIRSWSLFHLRDFQGPLFLLIRMLDVQNLLLLTSLYYILVSPHGSTIFSNTQTNINKQTLEIEQHCRLLLSRNYFVILCVLERAWSLNKNHWTIPIMLFALKYRYFVQYFISRITFQNRCIERYKLEK